MCRGSVGSILVMFDVLDCLLLFVYCIPVLEAPEANKIGKKIKKNPYDEHKVNMALGSTRAYVSYVRRPGGTDEHKGLRFVGFI
jgi:hypothetical protein